MVIEQLDAEPVAGPHPEVSEHVVLKRDLSLGGNGEIDGHDIEPVRGMAGTVRRNGHAIKVCASMLRVRVASLVSVAEKR